MVVGSNPIIATTDMAEREPKTERVGCATYQLKIHAKGGATRTPFFYATTTHHKNKYV